jgi:hypothetical protein
VSTHLGGSFDYDFTLWFLVNVIFSLYFSSFSNRNLHFFFPYIFHIFVLISKKKKLACWDVHKSKIVI